MSDQVTELHWAVCQAVALMNRSRGVAGCAEGREAHTILRQALVDYADSYMDQPASDSEREAVARKHRSRPLRKALAQQAEPVASDAYDMVDRFLRNNLCDDDYAEYSAALDSLYTTTTRREWVPLTDEQIKTVLKQVAESIDASSIVMTHWPLVARAVEAALKEKNK